MAGQFVFVEVESAEDAGVIEGFENLELLECNPSNGFVRCLVLAGNRVEADAARSSRGGVLGLKILIGEERIFLDQLFEDVITDTPLARGWSDTSFVERLGHTTSYASINSWAPRGLVAEIFPL